MNYLNYLYYLDYPKYPLSVRYFMTDDFHTRSGFYLCFKSNAYKFGCLNYGISMSSLPIFGMEQAAGKTTERSDFPHLARLGLLLNDIIKYYIITITLRRQICENRN